MSRDFARRLAASRMFLMEEDVVQIQHLVRAQLNLPVALRGPGVAFGDPLLVVDLGAGSGTTALAVFDEDDSARVWTIDISPQNIAWAEQAVRNAYPDAAWRSYCMDAALAGQQGEPWAVDLLMHDASHERANVEADLRAWVPRLAPHGAIWVHDYFDPPTAWGQPSSPGVKEAVDALVADGVIVPADELAIGMGWVGRKGALA